MVAPTLAPVLIKKCVPGEESQMHRPRIKVVICRVCRYAVHLAGYLYMVLIVMRSF